MKTHGNDSRSTQRRWLGWRDWLRIARSLGAVLALAGVLTACGSQAAAPTVNAPTTAPQAPASAAPSAVPSAPAVGAPTTAAQAATATVAGGAQPEYGGILTFNLNSDPPNFDFISNTTSSPVWAFGPCYNGLVIYDPLDPNKIIGDLAESWEVSPDGKAYTFKLIKGVKFHDRVPLTSADVKYTFDTVRNPPQGVVSARKALLAAVDSIETPDDYTVRFLLKQPSPSLLTNLASGWMVVLPKHILEKTGDMKKDVIGTGPFKLKEYVRGTSIELVKNPDYFVKGRPYLDGIKAYIIPDPSTAFANFRTGQLLMYPTITGADGRRAQQEFSDKVNIQNTASTSFVGMMYNSKQKPWDDVRVRQAASLAIDRNAALQTTLQGDGVLGGLMMPGPWALPAAELEKVAGYGPDSEADIAEAKKLLADAGFPNGFKTTLLVRNISPFQQAGVFVKDQWAKIGIDATLDVRESAAYLDAMAKRDFQATPYGASYQANDPDGGIGDFVTCAGSLNYTAVCSPELDDLYAKQSQTLRVDDRKKMVNQLELTALKNYGIFILYWRGRTLGLSRRVHDLMVHPNLDHNFRMQNVWLSK
ncbi:MAG: hypothetical protein KIT87_20325 [Anaerolineae bacterium]|nr:hypothetical protein [Anaerolineae bacterium]